MGHGLYTCPTSSVLDLHHRQYYVLSASVHAAWYYFWLEAALHPNDIDERTRSDGEGLTRSVFDRGRSGTAE